MAMGPRDFTDSQTRSVLPSTKHQGAVTFFLNELLLRRAHSVLVGGERLHLFAVGCEDSNFLVAWYALMTWFIDEDGRAFPFVKS